MYVRCLKGETYVKKVKQEVKKVEENTTTQPVITNQQAAPKGAVMELVGTDVVDFGTISKGSDPVRVLKYRNIGTEPLIIKKAGKVMDARGKDVLVATYPQSSTMLGETNQIEFRFDTNRVGPFFKMISITTNEVGDYGKDKERTIKVKGTVTE